MKKIISVLVFLIFALSAVTNQLQFSIIADNITPVRIVLVGFLLFVFGYFIFIEKSRAIQYVWSVIKRDRIFLVAILLFIWRLGSVIVNRNFGSGLLMLGFWGSLLGFYFLFGWLITKRKEATLGKFAIWGILIAVVGSVIIGIYQTVSFVGWGIQRFDLWGWQYPDGFRVPGLMLDSNHYGIFMVGGFFIVFWYLISHKKYLWSIVLSFFTIGAYSLSSSRSALVGLLLGGLLTMVILGLRREYKILVFFVLALGFGLTSGTAISKVIDVYTTNFLKTSIILHQEVGAKTAAKVASTLANSNAESIQFEGAFNFLNNMLPTRVKRVFDSSAQSHFAMIAASIKLGARFPIFGVGYGNFSTGLRNQPDIYVPAIQFDPRGLSEPKFPSHTLWGEQFAETGLVGFTLFAVLAFLILKKFIVSENPQGVFWAGLWIAFLAFAIFYSANEEFFWLIPFVKLLETHEN